MNKDNNYAHNKKINQCTILLKFLFFKCFEKNNNRSTGNIETSKTSE